MGVASIVPLLSNYREKLSTNITYEIEDKDFRSRSKSGRVEVFTRDRKLTISNLIVLMLCFKSSIQRELDSFFKAVSHSDFKIREVTKGAFTQARAKLDPWTLKRLNEVSVSTFYEGADYHVWAGRRVLAIDGTRLVLPNHESFVQGFGQHQFGPKSDSHRSLALGSMLYDVLNQITIDAQLAPYASSERDLLMQHLDKVKQGDLLLLDRGYPCFWLLFLLKAKGIEFCVRLKEDWWLKVNDFNTSQEIERIVTFTLPKKDRKKFEGFPGYQQEGASITCKLVKVKLETGENEILCTSLANDGPFLHHDFCELYNCRWGEEETYKLLKARIELENFSGKTARAVHQDFHAKILLMTLCAAYAHPIEERVRAEYKADANRKNDQKINRTNALSMTQDIMIAVIIRNQFEKALNAFDHIVSSTREIIRPGRSEPRKKRPRK